MSFSRMTLFLSLYIYRYIDIPLSVYIYRYIDIYRYIGIPIDDRYIDIDRC